MAGRGHPYPEEQGEECQGRRTPRPWLSCKTKCPAVSGCCRRVAGGNRPQPPLQAVGTGSAIREVTGPRQQSGMERKPAHLLTPHPLLSLQGRSREKRVRGQRQMGQEQDIVSQVLSGSRNQNRRSAGQGLHKPIQPGNSCSLLPCLCPNIHCSPTIVQTSLCWCERLLFAQIPKFTKASAIGLSPVPKLPVIQSETTPWGLGDHSHTSPNAPRTGGMRQ